VSSWQISSVPTVIAYKDGKRVAQFNGALVCTSGCVCQRFSFSQPEQRVKDFINELLD
jgi:thioredoxin-like negative regulator of GroEL